MGPISKKATKKTVKAEAPKAAAATRKRAPAKKDVRTVTPEERQRLVEQAAYFRAEKDGFRGDPQAYWVAAEAEVEALLSAKK